MHGHSSIVFELRSRKTRNPCLILDLTSTLETCLSRNFRPQLQTTPKPKPTHHPYLGLGRKRPTFAASCCVDLFWLVLVLTQQMLQHVSDSPWRGYRDGTPGVGMVYDYVFGVCEWFSSFEFSTYSFWGYAHLLTQGAYAYESERWNVRVWVQGQVEKQSRCEVLTPHPNTWLCALHSKISTIGYGMYKGIYTCRGRRDEVVSL